MLRRKMIPLKDCSLIRPMRSSPSNASVPLLELQSSQSKLTSLGTLFFTSEAKWKLSFDMHVVPLC